MYDVNLKRNYYFGKFCIQIQTFLTDIYYRCSQQRKGSKQNITTFALYYFKVMFLILNIQKLNSLVIYYL